MRYTKLDFRKVFNRYKPDTKEKEVLSIIENALDYALLDSNEDRLKAFNEALWTKEEILIFIDDNFKSLKELKLQEAIKERARNIKNNYDPEKDPVLQDFKRKIEAIREGKY